MTLPPSHEDTFTLTLNYKGEARDEFWIKRSSMPPWTSGLLSIMTLGSVTQELPSVIRLEAFQRGGNGRVEIKEWFAAGKE